MVIELSHSKTQAMVNNLRDEGQETRASYVESMQERIDELENWIEMVTHIKRSCAFPILKKKCAGCWCPPKPEDEAKEG